MVDSIYVIHNHNWISSAAVVDSGKCTISANYGSGSVTRGLRVRNIFAETATSCAVGLRINKKAFNRHTTPTGCVGSIYDTRIDSFFADEPFKLPKAGYNNYVGGEVNVSAGCTGELSGRVDGFAVAGSVDGRNLDASDFSVHAGTVSGVTFGAPQDPHPVPTYAAHFDMKADATQGALAALDLDGVSVSSADRCIARCHSDLSCDCVVYDIQHKECYKMRGCNSTRFYADAGHDVYVRPGRTEVPTAIGVAGCRLAECSHG